VRRRLDEEEDILGVVDGKGRVGKRGGLSGYSVGCRLGTSLSLDSDQSLYIVSSSGSMMFLIALASSSSSFSARRILSLILVAISACNAWVFALYTCRRVSVSSLLLAFRAL
jgi:hypothetical protein